MQQNKEETLPMTGSTAAAPEPEPEAQASSSWGIFSRQTAAQRAEAEYASVLSTQDDFADLDAMDFLRVDASRDKMGRPVILFIAKNFHPKLVHLDRLYRYIAQRCDATVNGIYSVVWVHTCSTYFSNCPSIAWLWRTYERLPAKYRANMSHVYVLHCDLNLWLTSMVLCPWLSGLLWRKITWVRRVEFLWDYMAKVRLPAFIGEHDDILEDQPLTDYGLVTSKEMTVAGMPNPM